MTPEGLINNANEKLYKFDNVLGEDRTNQDLFDEILEPMVWQAMEGYNGTFAPPGC
ncbi:MAG: hypothetical protein P4M11_02360 [Candidatus Pacebacteria bacterium]|nr:hypothetical protein [Candidatus Paceibacterota bacterium]